MIHGVNDLFEKFVSLLELNYSQNWYIVCHWCIITNICRSVSAPSRSMTTLPKGGYNYSVSVLSLIYRYWRLRFGFSSVPQYDYSVSVLSLIYRYWRLPFGFSPVPQYNYSVSVLSLIYRYWRLRFGFSSVPQYNYSVSVLSLIYRYWRLPFGFSSVPQYDDAARRRV